MTAQARPALWRLLLAALCATVGDYAVRAAVVLDGNLSPAELRAALGGPRPAAPLHLVDRAPELHAALGARLRADIARGRVTERRASG